MGKEKRVTRGCKLGVKIKITQKDLPEQYKKFPLKETVDGVQSSVYLLGDKYVLKIYDEQDYNIEDEIRLLNTIRVLSVIQYVEHIYIKGYLCVFYIQIVGDSIYNPKVKHIKQTALFLKGLHAKTANLVSNNVDLFDKNKLNAVLSKRGLSILQNHFNTIDIELRNDGIIHGDIYPDNVKWIDNTLSGVYDFSEACNGDFRIDLAVVASSWCFDDDKPNYHKINTLLCSYGLDMPMVEFKEYIKYALVYYATTRYLNGRNYQELINRLENI
jgi:homoserine kinase type II